MKDMPTMRAAFRTTISGAGKYEMVFRFPTMDAMHKADDEWAAALSTEAGIGRDGFQAGVQQWMLACFGVEITGDLLERADRFTEEALELVQTMPGFTAERAHALVDYVFNRPVGDRHQEVGGVMVTLAALCNPVGLNIEKEAERELARVWTKVEAIRAKQAAKPTGSALPIAAIAEAGKPAPAEPVADDDIINRAADIIAAKVSGPNMHRSEKLKTMHRLDQIEAARAIITLVRPAPSDNQKMREALEPFARIAKWVENTDHRDGNVVHRQRTDSGWMDLTKDDFRRAASALSQHGEGGENG